MKIDLTGKLAIVTGSTAGIGYSIAKGLAGTGAEVVINGRTQARVDAAIAAIKKDVPAAKLRGAAADVGTAEGCAALVKAVPACDILVNNTGIFIPHPFADITDADWTRTWEVNVMSGVRLSRAYIEAMRKKNWGRIVFISSESGQQIPKEMIDYGVSKAAQLAVARGLAQDVAATGVTVNTVMPGPTRSEGVETFLADLSKQSGKTPAEVEADFFKTVRPSSIIQRFTTTDEVAHMVVYVCSKEASGTTGAPLRVDGGVVQSIV
jgi:NAD(P)-dependent dehydrogenase (short-subunit alcohol dehydrogenase family)